MFEKFQFQFSKLALSINVVLLIKEQFSFCLVGNIAYFIITFKISFYLLFTCTIYVFITAFIIKFLIIYVAENKIEFLPSASYFSIVADSVDSLTAVIENLKTKGFNKLTKKLNVYLSDAKKHKFRLEGLEALYRQWHDYQNRAPEYFTNILNLWLSNEGPVYPKKGEEEFPVLGIFKVI